MLNEIEIRVSGTLWWTYPLSEVMHRSVTSAPEPEEQLSTVSNVLSRMKTNHVSARVSAMQKLGVFLALETLTINRLLP